MIAAKRLPHILCLMTKLLLVLPTVNCRKQPIENPFTAVLTLDCRNLIIRKVSLAGSFVEVTMENTCKNCTDNWVYLALQMMRRSNPLDTLAATCGTCLSCPQKWQDSNVPVDHITNKPARS